MKKTWILLTAGVLFVAGLILHFTIGNQFSAGDFTCNYFEKKVLTDVTSGAGHCDTNRLFHPKYL